MKLKLPYLAAIAGLGLLMAQPAQAALVVTLTDGLGNFFHCQDNAGACDVDGAPNNLITLGATVGNFHVQGTIETTTVGLLNVLTLTNFGATNNGAAAGTLNMYVSDTNFLGPVSQIAESADIVFSNAIGSGPSTLEFYADTNNGQSANTGPFFDNIAGVLLATVTKTPTTNPQSFQGDDISAFVDGNLYSMTEVAHINLIGGGNFTNFGMNMQATPTPIPAALPMFGAAVAGAGVFGRWRRKRIVALTPA